MPYIYEKGYAQGERDAKAHEPIRCDDRSWFGQGYRDGYLDARRAEQKGR